jgi:DNA-binding transcriptional regulator GbsR (MarR family)
LSDNKKSLYNPKLSVISETMKEEAHREAPGNALIEAREEFVSQWGAIGSAWGINRTMAQIHALLLTAPEPLGTDEIMRDLQISRGNANTNLRDLVGWGLIRTVLRKGERREFFEAEKDVWKMFCIIARERKRREIHPAIEVLQRCAGRTAGRQDAATKGFHRQMQELCEFLQLGERALEAVASSEQSRAVRFLSKLVR